MSPGSRPASAVEHLPAVGAPADPDLRAAFAFLRIAVLVADPRRAVAGRADEHDVRDVDRGRDVEDAARLHLHLAHPAGIAHRPRPAVLLHDVQVLDDHAPVGRTRLEDATLLAAIFSGEHLDEVALLDLHPRRHYRTSGASETIFMKFFSRSSRATGPKIRVPRGLRWLSISTAAFSSKPMLVPSSLWNGLRVRTTTASTTSPFLTAPCGVAALTVAVITSPTRA